jgi:hypothetical protein
VRRDDELMPPILQLQYGCKPAGIMVSGQPITSPQRLTYVVQISHRENTMETTCKECGKPAIGIAFTRGSDDVAVCKSHANTTYKGWRSQTLSTAASPMGRIIRSRVQSGEIA